MNSNRHVTFLPIINYILTTYKDFIKNLLDTREILSINIVEQKTRVMLVFSTRPEAIKVAPLVEAF